MGFSNYLVTKTGFLVRQFIRSFNYVAGVSGFTINKDGSAEFNNVTIRGGEVIDGTALYYSGTPASGNLVFSIAGVATTDAEGNPVNAGAFTYSFDANGDAAGFINGRLSFLNSGGNGVQAGLSLAGNLTWFSTSGSRNIDVSALGLIAGTASFSGPVTATGGTPASPTLITTDTWHLMTPLLNGWANVAGYATARYRLTPDNEVEIIAAISAAAAANATFFTLPNAPVNYRPASQQPVSGAGASGSVPAGLAPWCRCDTSGNLTVQNTGAVGAAWQFFVHGFISLDA